MAHHDVSCAHFSHLIPQLCRLFTGIFSSLKVIVTLCFQFFANYILFVCKLLPFRLLRKLSPHKTRHLPYLHESFLSFVYFCCYTFPICPKNHMFQMEAAFSIWILEWKGMSSKTIANSQQRRKMNEK